MALFVPSCLCARKFDGAFAGERRFLISHKGTKAQRGRNGNGNTLLQNPNPAQMLASSHPNAVFYARPDAANLSDIQNVKEPDFMSQIQSNISRGHGV
jgi:hypothetical protein